MKMCRCLFWVFAAQLGACRSSPSPRPEPTAGPSGDPKNQSGNVDPPGVDMSILDATVDPCTDFFRYACGGWMDKTDIPPDRPAWSRGFMAIHERNEQILKRILEDAAAGKVADGVPYGKALGDYFGSCMDEKSVEAGRDTLLAEVALLQKGRKGADFVQAVAGLHARAVFPFFRLGSTQDFRDSTKVIAELDQAGLGLPERDYYLEQNPRMEEIRKAYLAHVPRGVRLLGQADPQASDSAAAVVEVERQLAEASLDKVSRRDPAKLYHPTNLADLKKLAPAIPWDGYFKTLKLTPSGTVNVTHPAFFERVSALLKSIPAPKMGAYLTWQWAHAVAPDAHKALVDEDFAFQSQAFTGAKEDLPRWKKCVAMTDDALGEALAVPFVLETFGEHGKTVTQEMVANVEKAFAANLATLTWMDAATKDKALGKLNKIVNKIGYPERWRQYDTLRIERGPFLSNAVRAAEFEFRRDLGKIGKPLDRTEWYMTPPTVNAYYNPLMNEIVFPAGILQPPFFNRDATPPVNYGGMGMVVGHEITHGFDDEGSKFDEDGNLMDWWSKESGAAFGERTQCVKRQFDGYVAIDDVKVNGALTLGENVADLGGLKLAHAAMHEATKTWTDAGKYRFTPSQQFFLGYAQSWCSKYRDEHARLRAATDPHAPPRLRVNGPLGNLAAFATAFECKDGSPMVRPAAERCEVW
jgi:endothelin-converting enzyme/putative endopeptidase